MQSAVTFLLFLVGVVWAKDGKHHQCTIKDPIQVHPHENHYHSKPMIDGAKFFHGGKIVPYEEFIVDVTSPIVDASTGKRTVIGRLAQNTKEDVQLVLESAKRAWDRGQGTWPQMSPAARIRAIENVVNALKARRDEIINVLKWEICKSTEDATTEFDRTMKFIEATIKAFRDMDSLEGDWTSIGGIYAKIRRAAIGIVLCLGPFNYPFNETYATLIPALLMGNVVIMKLPTTGGLAHILTMEAYMEHLPPGVMNFIAGSGRELLGPLMATGDIDVLAFIGGSKAADSLIKAHPHPHRLKVFLQLEGKNLGIVLPDADLDVATDQIVLGSTSYNGQRCTAIKLVMLHSSVASELIKRLHAKIGQLVYGAPWEPKVAITPLPEPNKPKYLMELIEDAVQHGAKVINAEDGGCDMHGALMRPALVYPVTSQMRLWHEEQFGPVIPIAVYNEIEEIHDYYRNTHYGQQAAVFTNPSNASHVSSLLDILSTAVGRVNFNTQCGRSPDTLPFSGRRSSAMGTMSVSEALRTFSVEVVIAAKHTEPNEVLLKNVAHHSDFLAPLHSLQKHGDDL